MKITTMAAISALCLLTGTYQTSGWQNQGASLNQPVEITFQHVHKGPYGTAVDTLIDAFHQQHPHIRVTAVATESGDYEGILRDLSTGSQFPHVVQAGYSYTQEMIDNMPIVPVEAFIEEENMDTSDFFPELLSLGTDKSDTLYSLPFVASTPVLYYNQDLLKAASIDPAKLKTFDDVRQAAKAMTKGEQYGIYYSFTMSGNWIVQAMIESFGGRMLDDQKEIAFVSPEGEKAVQHLVDLIQVDQSMPPVNESVAYQQFLDGKLAMFVNTSATLAALQREAEFHVGTVAFPSDSIHPRKIPVGGNGLFIMKSTPEKEKAAWEFIKFVTSPEGNAAFAKDTGYMTVRQSAVEREDLLGQLLREKPEYRTPYLHATEFTRWVSIPTSESSAYYIMQNNIIQALSYKKTALQALEESAEQIRALRPIKNR